MTRHKNLILTIDTDANTLSRYLWLVFECLGAISENLNPLLSLFSQHSAEFLILFVRLDPTDQIISNYFAMKKNQNPKIEVAPLKLFFPLLSSRIFYHNPNLPACTHPLISLARFLAKIITSSHEFKSFGPQVQSTVGPLINRSLTCSHHQLLSHLLTSSYSYFYYILTL
jgi:hypothetical protein